MDVARPQKVVEAGTFKRTRKIGITIEGLFFKIYLIVKSTDCEFGSPRFWENVFEKVP